MAKADNYTNKYICIKLIKVANRSNVLFGLNFCPIGSIVPTKFKKKLSKSSYFFSNIFNEVASYHWYR